jgi:hypothetical protein
MAECAREDPRIMAAPPEFSPKYLGKFDVTVSREFHVHDVVIGRLEEEKICMP